MIGCFRLLDMAVMMGHCTLRQIRETGCRRHVSMTPIQTARHPGKQAGRPFLLLGEGSDLHMGKLGKDF